MFMVPTTLFRVPHALLMVPPTLFMAPTPNDHGSTDSNFLQGSKHQITMVPSKLLKVSYT